MQKYDVVLLVDASLAENVRKEVVSEFESLIKKTILQTDEIWLQQLKYDLWSKAWNDKAYIYSYNIEATAEDLAIIKKHLLYNKAIKRYYIFRMEKNEDFLIFGKVNDELNAVIESWDAKKLWQKIAFFADKKNSKYLNWKAVTMLKKYITRFGNIKPREYTNNSVAIQKKLKTTILRTRELGLLEYTK
jgi:ribosomal protein S18/ribosomal protein S6